MSLISFKIFQCVSWRDTLASSTKNRLNAKTIGAALGVAHRSPCEPHKGLTGRWMGGAWLPWRGASAPGVNRALQMRSLALSTVGEFEKERTRLGPKSHFFLPWEIGCVAWERVKTCKSVCHTAKPWELAALVQLSSVDNNYASLNIRHILRCSDWL